MKVGKATSDWNVMKRGCPQGSSFGPTLWNLYQNDLSYHINEIANLNMYADDHQMYIVGSGMSIMCTNVEKEGNSALKWHKNNYLLSNPEKLNAMHVVWLSFHCWCHASVVIYRLAFCTHRKPDKLWVEKEKILALAKKRTYIV